MAGAQARPCSSFIMTGWSFEAAEQAGSKGRSSLAGEEGKTNLTGDSGEGKDIGRTGNLGSICLLDLFIKNNPVMSFSPRNCTSTQIPNCRNVKTTFFCHV